VDSVAIWISGSTAVTADENGEPSRFRKSAW
jgi:hypothetical protein